MSGAPPPAAAGPPPSANAPAVTVIDAGVGNLGNLERALRHLGAAVEVTADARRVAPARCLVLPGVGAFAPPRQALRGPLEEALRAALAAGAWLLGICVGFQLLFETGEEFGVTDGLGLLPGRVTRLPASVPVPHIGWNRLHSVADHPLLAGLGGIGAMGAMGAIEHRDGEPRRDRGIAASSSPGDVGEGGAGRHVYFVHSYAPEAVPEEICLARATHGRSFAAVAGHRRVLGAQFHPERSGTAGLRLLANFLDLSHGPAAGA